MGVLKKIVISSFIFPFLLLTLSFCCFKMMMPMLGAHAMDYCPSMASSDTMQHGLNSLGIACTPHSSNCHCEQIAESYDKTALKSVDSYKLSFNNLKAIIFASHTFTYSALAPPSFSYHSPPKIAQNSLPLYFQLSVLRI